MAKEEVKKEEVKKEEVKKEEVKKEVTVTFRLGKRVYSKEIHGADFEKLAEEFAKKQNGTVA